MKLFKKPIIEIPLVIFCVLFILFLGYRMTFHQSIVNQENKMVLRNIMNSLELGFSKEIVKETFNKLKTEDLKLNVRAENAWVIEMPCEFGATDWLLYINFKNEAISSLKMRTRDTDSIPPSDAPVDKISAK